jgi:hypothetical protein
MEVVMLLSSSVSIAGHTGAVWSVFVRETDREGGT